MLGMVVSHQILEHVISTKDSTRCHSGKCWPLLRPQQTLVINHRTRSRFTQKQPAQQRSLGNHHRVTGVSIILGSALWLPLPHKCHITWLQSSTLWNCSLQNLHHLPPHQIQKSPSSSSMNPVHMLCLFHLNLFNLSTLPPHCLRSCPLHDKSRRLQPELISESEKSTIHPHSLKRSSPPPVAFLISAGWQAFKAQLSFQGQNYGLQRPPPVTLQKFVMSRTICPL